MADGYARATGDVGVCMTVPGPGSNNASIGIGEANTASSPVLWITGQNPSYLAQRGSEEEFPRVGSKSCLQHPMTKHLEIVHRVDQIPGAINRSFSALRSGRLDLC